MITAAVGRGLGLMKVVDRDAVLRQRLQETHTSVLETEAGFERIGRGQSLVGHAQCGTLISKTPTTCSCTVFAGGHVRCSGI